jgi:peptidoglycan biosynthesis protein MviN/MurJ (putative lipid II flippase)
VMTGLNIPLYWWLVRRAQYRGLALASSIGIILYTIVLFVLLNRRTQNHESGALVLFFVKVSAASAGAAVACYIVLERVERFLPWHRAYGALATLALATAAGVIVLALLLKLFKLSEFEHYLRRMLAVARRRMGRVPGNAPGL